MEDRGRVKSTMENEMINTREYIFNRDMKNITAAAVHKVDTPRPPPPSLPYLGLATAVIHPECSETPTVPIHHPHPHPIVTHTCLTHRESALQGAWN